MEFLSSVWPQTCTCQDRLFMTKTGGSKTSTWYYTTLKVVTGAKKNTTARTDALIRHEVMMYHSVTAASMKKNMHKFSRRRLLGLSSTVCKRIRKNAMSRTAKKPLIIKVMMKKRILFCNIYKHWTMADWRKVIFCNESTSRLVLRWYKLVVRLQESPDMTPGTSSRL